jgi:hypothetical protein
MWDTIVPYDGATLLLKTLVADMHIVRFVNVVCDHVSMESALRQ